MLDLNDFAKKVHTNARNKGWWDEPRTLPEICALIHSEWSEALEAYRSHEPMIWFDKDKNNKPDGVAVELIDGCIRILDWMGHVEFNIFPSQIDSLINIISTRRSARLKAMELPELVATLHVYTADAHRGEPTTNTAGEALMGAMVTAFYWLMVKGVDCEDVLLKKHKYNLTRSYKHGGKAI